MNLNLVDAIVESCRMTENSKIISPIQIGGDSRKNELILFIKPELFMVEDNTSIKNSIELVLGKIDEFNAFIDGVVILGGKVLNEYKIMDRHYGFINQLSRNASLMLTKEDISIMAKHLNVPIDNQYTVLGGHEYLNKYPEDTPGDLDKLWFSKKSIKLRSGFYFQEYNKNNDHFLLINGFHPAQLSHFTHPDHRIVLFLIHSNTEWKTLRNEMVGATFPEKAVPNSIRGSLFADPQKYGLSTVSIANNGVHLSAGPFEAAFEIRNFLGQILNVDWNVTAPAIVSNLSKKVDLSVAYSVLDNPQIDFEGKDIDLFTATEDQNAEDAIDIWIKNKK